MIRSEGLASVGRPAVEADAPAAIAGPLGHVGFAKDNGAGISQFFDSQGIAGDCSPYEET